MGNSYRILLNPPAEEAELVILSTSELKYISGFEEYVLKIMGYQPDVMRLLQLKKGYDLLEQLSFPILFVVTVSNDVTASAVLRTNLSRALREKSDFLLNRKKVWLPLLGTNIGGLTYQESLQIMVNILDEFKEEYAEHNTEFIIAVPDDKDGRSIFDSLQADHPDNDDTFKNIIESGTARFFLVGSSWDGEEQAQRFYKQGIWETGYDEKYSNTINSIVPGDALIHKSAYPGRNGISYLRFKSYGIVTENFENGTTVGVSWIIKDQKIDIEDLGYHRNTITESSTSDVLTILESLPTPLRRRILASLRHPSQRRVTRHIAGLISDMDSGTDYLNIMPDVNSFSLLLAAKSFEPPLAVALLGRWGSGKSFFMNKLKQQIEQLSNSADTYFCEGIVHVHFNAWSYMDANLWASITTRIFEGLQNYIREDDEAKKYVREIEKELTENLSLTKDKLAGLKSQNDEIENQLKELHIKKKKNKEELDEKIKEVKLNSLEVALAEVDDKFDVTGKIEKAIEENESIVRNVEQFKRIVPMEYWCKPEEVYKKITSVSAIIRLFTTSQNRVYNWVWLIGSILLFAGVPYLAVQIADKIKSTSFLLSPQVWGFITIVGALYVRAVKVYRKAKPFFARLWQIKEEYLKARDTAISKFEQEQKALNYEIEYKKDELDVISNQISSVEIVQSTIVFKMENALSTTALHQFIEKRCNSDDYKKHLGLVSIIRKDFEILSDLFSGHKKEISTNSDKKTFTEMFKKPLERIILYVDDLDRCPEDRVVEVLEAVNLLMAFPLFVVVVGVDPVWVKNALITKYKKQFSSMDKNYEYIDPSTYLEKIFQIPFHLKQADNASIKGMLKGLSKVQNFSGEKDQGHQRTVFDDAPGREESIKTIEKAEQLQRVSVDVDHKTIVMALSFSENELASIEEMSLLVGSSPRLIKRYINIYRIVKSHDYISRESEIGDRELRNILFVLALSIGKFKIMMPALTTFFETADPDWTIKDYFRKMSVEEANLIGNQLHTLLHNYLPDLITERAENICRHLSFIKRFTL